jgi:hypothetical protein
VVGLLSQLEWFGDGKSVESPPFIIVCGELGVRRALIATDPVQRCWRVWRRPNAGNSIDPAIVRHKS